jgi:hypothetical protein
MISSLGQRSRLSVVVCLSLVGAAGCDEEKPKPAASATATASAAPEPEAPKAKQVPKDIEAFLSWAEGAGKAIEKGPEATDAHPVLGKISCQDNKEAHDFGYCSAFKSATRYAAQWVQKEPKLWAAHLMQDSASSWVDCKLLGKDVIRDSEESNAVMHHCKHSDGVEVWVRHYEPPGAARNTQVWLFSKDFPDKEGEPPSAPRPALYQNLNK